MSFFLWALVAAILIGSARKLNTRRKPSASSDKCEAPVDAYQRESIKPVGTNFKKKHGLKKKTTNVALLKTYLPIREPFGIPPIDEPTATKSSRAYARL